MREYIKKYKYHFLIILILIITIIGVFLFIKYNNLTVENNLGDIKTVYLGEEETISTKTYINNYKINNSNINIKSYKNNEIVIEGINLGESSITIDSGKEQEVINILVCEQIKLLNVPDNIILLYLKEQKQLEFNISGTCLTNYEMSIENSEIVELNNNKLIPKKEGETLLIFKRNNIETKYTLIVKDKKQNVEVTKIDILEDNLEMEKGSSKYINTSILPYDATDKSIIYTTSNKNVVTVSSSGLLVAKSKGQAIITATTKNGLSDTLSVNVYENHFSINKDISKLNIDETITINSNSKETISCNTSNNKIFVVSISDDKKSCVVKGVTPGIAILTASNSKGSDTLSITVKPQEKEEIAFMRDSYNTTRNEKVVLKLKKELTKNNRITQCVSRNSSIAVASIVENGCEVVGKSNGNTRITILTSNGVASATVNVSSYLINSEDFLKVNGTKFIKTGNDNGIVLRGYNLGEWLSRAISLSPVLDANKTGYNDSQYNDEYYREYADNNVQINYVLTKRFGKEKAFELNELYYENFITSDDIKTISELGVNVLRVPIEWSYFADIDFIEPSSPITPTKPIDMNVYKYNYKLLSGLKLEKRLSTLDWIVSECRKHGIYVIFDLHVVEGGQNDGGIMSARGHYNFFKNNLSQENAIEIWKIIARRFNNNPGVAGYELLNEPASGYTSNNPQGYRKELINFYDRAYKAIRNIDSKHIIIMESPMSGIYTHQIYESNDLITLPTENERINGIYDSSRCPATNCKWTNVAYSIHDYFQSVSDNELKSLISQKVNKNVNDMKKYNVPIYIGEINFYREDRNDDVNNLWKYAMNLYDNNLFSYTFWTYKAAKSIKYGLVYNLNSKKNPNSFAKLLTDTSGQIENKFKLNTISAKYDYQSDHVNIIKSNFINNSNKPLINKSSYECNKGQTLIISSRIFSKDGSSKITNVSTVSPLVAEAIAINPTGVVCTSSSCQTIKIVCKNTGSTSLFVQSNNNLKETAIIKVN